MKPILTNDICDVTGAVLGNVSGSTADDKICYIIKMDAIEDTISKFAGTAFNQDRVACLPALNDEASKLYNTWRRKMHADAAKEHETEPAVLARMQISEDHKYLGAEMNSKMSLKQ